MTRLRHDCGQAYVISILFLSFVLVGMTAAVLDVGSWFRADRALQSRVDAAALAGAQALPANPGQATSLAIEYGSKNGGGIAGNHVAFSMAMIPNDTITVDATAPAPGFFSKIFDIDTVTVHAKASARVAGLLEAKYVAPIVVNWKHPQLQCNPNPCQGPAELNYQHLKEGKGNGDDDDDDDGGPTNDGAGSFGFINLTGDNGVGTSDLGSWIQDGFDQFMPLGNYLTSTGNPFSSSHVKDSLEARTGTVLLFPVYQTLTGTGNNAEYKIIGWVGYRLTGMDLHGTSEKLFGEFTEVIWEGIQVSSGGQGGVNFGAQAVALVE